jgi:two-component system, OmpR family, sensor kinase
MSTREATDLRRTSIRLAVQFGAVSVVLLAALIGITFAIVGASLAESVNEVLVDASLVPGVADAPHDVLLAFSVGGRVTVSRDAPGWFPDKALFAAAAKSDDPITTTRTEQGHTYEIRTDSDPGRLVQAAVDTGESSEELRRLGLALGISGLIAALAAALLAAWMSQRAMRPMVEALALQRRFVMDASHELRTPLTVLSTRAQLLRRELSEGRHPESIAGEVDGILQDSRELTGILEDLLIAADPRETMVTAPVDLADLAREAVTAFALQASNAGIALRLEGDAISVPVNGSRSSLLRLFTSLISNAIDHADNLVIVAVMPNGRNAEITVRDDGPGFPDSMRTQAFDRFATSRSNTGASAQPRHYGLGLALVADVAARHHGSVAVDPSRPGTGAVIRVTIPLRKS